MTVLQPFISTFLASNETIIPDVVHLIANTLTSSTRLKVHVAHTGAPACHLKNRILMLSTLISLFENMHTLSTLPIIPSIRIFSIA